MRFRSGLRWTPVPDVAAVDAREEFGHRVSDSGCMCWGARSTFLFLCVYTISLFHLSPLRAIVLLLVS